MITQLILATHFFPSREHPILSQIGTPNCLIYFYFECLTDNSNLTCQKNQTLNLDFPHLQNVIFLKLSLMTGFPQTFSHDRFKPKTWASLIRKLGIEYK